MVVEIDGLFRYRIVGLPLHRVGRRVSRLQRHREGPGGHGVPVAGESQSFRLQELEK
jgi:hypothetical protein